MTSASSKDTSSRNSVLLATVVLALIVGFVWVSRKSSGPVTVETFSGSTMATTWSVKVVSATLTPAKRGEILDAINAELEKVNDSMSHYRKGSEISRFNEAKAGQWVEVSTPLVELLQVARGISEKTDGAFDVTVGPLVGLWGFDDKEGRMQEPAAEEMEAAGNRVGFRHLLIEDKRISKDKEGLRADLSSIAKGYAVDRVALALESMGYQDIMVEVGGEIRVRGSKPGGVPWRIGVEKPQDDGRQLLGGIDLTEPISVATSGDYRNFYLLDGVRVSHTIDPRTREPVGHATASVTVVHPQCEVADGWATALTVLGAKEGIPLAEKLGLEVLFIERTDGEPKLTMTSAFRKRVGDDWPSREEE